MKKNNIKKVNKGKIKNMEKRSKLVEKSGTATAETVLIIAVLLVVIVTIFYPQISRMVTNTMNNLVTWYENSLSNLGMF